MSSLRIKTKTNRQLILSILITTIVPATSLASDWSILEPGTVCKHLDWNGSKKTILVGAGENVSEPNEALDAQRRFLELRLLGERQ